MKHPSPRKLVNGVTVYASRRLDVPKFFGDSVLSDSGSAARGDEKRNYDAGPQVYRVRIILPLLSRFSKEPMSWNISQEFWAHEAALKNPC